MMLSASPATFAGNNPGELVIEIHGFESTGGTVMIDLYTSEDDYDNDGNVFRKARFTVKEEETVWTFGHLPQGVYAVKLYYDENNNGQLDTGFFGIPKEGIGFSNNARAKTGPPAFEEAMFEINGGVVRQRIRLNRM